MAMYCYVCVCRGVYGYVWLFMAMQDYVRLCTATYGCVWLCRAMKDYVGLCTLLLVTNGEPLYDAYTTYLPHTDVHLVVTQPFPCLSREHPTM